MSPKVSELDDEHGNIQSSLDYFSKFKFKKRARILDLGCGFGSLVYNLHEIGYKEASGIDTDKKKLKKGKKAYPSISERVAHYKGGTLPFGENEFDVVLMFDVIEHIPDIDRFLKKEVRRVLKNKGYFVFQTPNKVINIPWSVIQQRSFTKYKRYHVSLQGYFSLKRLLLRSGFRKIVVEKHNILTAHNIKKVRGKLGPIGYPVLVAISHFPLVFYSNFWGSCRK